MTPEQHLLIGENIEILVDRIDQMDKLIAMPDQVTYGHALMTINGAKYDIRVTKQKQKD